jgi:hypothetical protein
MPGKVRTGGSGRRTARAGLWHAEAHPFAAGLGAGQKKAQERLLENLKEEFVHVQREYHLHPGKAAHA